MHFCNYSIGVWTILSSTLSRVPTGRLTLIPFYLHGPSLELFGHCRSPRFTSLVLSGGAAHTKRLEDLQRFQATGATILVATPGRLVDLVQKAPLFLGQASNNQTFNPIVRGLRSLVRPIAFTHSILLMPSGDPDTG